MRLPAPLRHGCGAVLTFVLTAALAPLAAAQGLSDKAKPQAYADPADAISADLAFLRLAREKGLVTAAKATAAPEAKIVQGSNLQWPAVPTPSTLADFLTHSAATYGVPRWPVQQVWMSCDGAVAVTAGVLESHVTGVTVWQRQKKGGYKWLLHMDDFASSLPAPAPANPASSEDAADAEMISASVAECPARARHGGAMPATAMTS